jgi:uncharacterized membrane protein
MKTIEKIAVIWTAPLFAIAIIGLGIVSTVLYLLKAVWIYSGTAGASIMMVREVRKKFNRATWRRLQKTDEMMAEIDKRVKNN